jgi:hypothetical protein
LTLRLWWAAGFESKEQVRPEYKGKDMLSLVSDKQTRESSLWIYRIKLGTSIGLITLAIGCVIAAVAAIFAFRFALESTSASAYAATLASILNSIQITVLNALYSKLALYLSKWENHKTDTQYQVGLSWDRAVMLPVGTEDDGTGPSCADINCGMALLCRHHRTPSLPSCSPSSSSTRTPP